MPRALLSIWLVCFAALGCEPPADTGNVFVEVQTDWIPGEEMRSVRVTLASQSVPDRILATEARDAAGGPAEEAAFRDGLRIAEIGPLGHGPYQVIVELRDPDGVVFASRVLRFQLSQDALAVRAVLTRDCGGLDCPGGGAPELTECYGGRCVDPRCRPGGLEHCPVPACSEAAECVASAECATGACVSGACLSFGDSSACDDGEVCDPDEGCRPPRPPMPDAGMDSAMPDTSMPDTGPTYDPNADPDLILWVPMDEIDALDRNLQQATTTLDVRCFGTNCPSTGVAAQSGRGFGFNGSTDVLRIMNHPMLVTTSGFTLAIWARIPRVPIIGPDILMAKPFDSAFRNSWELGFVDVDSDGEGELSFVVDSLTGEATASAEHGLPGATWAHIAAVWEPSSRRLFLYLDGAMVASSAESVTPSFDVNDGFIGADSNNRMVDSHFEGDLDDARVYRRALTAEEIAAVMSAPPP